jgi:hypothetical protein
MLTKHEFITWLFNRGCFVKINDKSRTITHVAYDGGKLCVPDHLMDEFWRLYQQCIEDKPEHSLCLCENITQVCKMFCDLDVLEDVNSVDPFDLDSVLEIMHETVMHHFSKSFQIVVCKTPLKDVTKNGVKYKKTGIHLYWKGLYLAPSICLDLSKQFVQAVEAKLGKRSEFVNPWSDVIDERVYKTSLRMIYSKKMGIKKVNGVVIKTPKPEVYTIDKIYPNKETGTVDLGSEWKYCTIQTYRGEEPTIPNNPIKEFVNIREIKGTRITDDVEKKVEQFIQWTLKDWADYPLASLLKIGSGFTAKLTGAQYCLNNGKEHKTCGIFFTFNQDGMTQRCFCKCDQMRPSGVYCKDFKSRVFPLPIELSNILFPVKKKKRHRKHYDPSKPESFSSNLLLKHRDTLPDYLKMSWNTIMELEKKC